MYIQISNLNLTENCCGPRCDSRLLNVAPKLFGSAVRSHVLTFHNSILYFFSSVDALCFLGGGTALIDSNTTFSDGCLGSNNDEGRSEMR